MAMTVRYLTIGGEIVSETRSGVRSDYIPDPLGSTAALINSSHTITDTFLWWPYGEQRSHVGSSVTPFGYAGTVGYYGDAVGSRLYIRKRLLRPKTTCWQTIDPVWPSELAFVYGRSTPVTLTDPSGYLPGEGGACECGTTKSFLDHTDLWKREGNCGTSTGVVTCYINGCFITINGKNYDMPYTKSWAGDPTVTCNCSVVLVTHISWSKSCVCEPVGAWGCTPICSWNCSKGHYRSRQSRKKITICPIKDFPPIEEDL